MLSDAMLIESSNVKPRLSPAGAIFIKICTGKVANGLTGTRKEVKCSKIFFFASVFCWVYR